MTTNLEMTAGHRLLLLSAFWLALSLPWLAMAESGGQIDIRYGPDPQQRLDVCLPSDPHGPLPALVMIHGGSWRAGSKAEWRTICRAAAEAGVAAFAIDYRLADGTSAHGWPAQLVDAQLAIRWVRASARQYDVDPGHICAIGDSAGGQLSVFLAALDRASPGEYADQLPGVSPKVDCAVDWFGPVDLVGAIARYPNMMRTLFPDAHPGYGEEAERSASPLFRIGPGTAPILIAQGTEDRLVPVRQSEKLHEALTAARVPSQLWLYRGGHEFERAKDRVPEFAEAAVAFVKDPLTFLKERTPPPLSP